MFKLLKFRIMSWKYIAITIFCFITLIYSEPCPPPDVPFFGTYQPKKSSFLPGDKIVYHCEDGFGINGNEVRTCESNGNWSDQTPFCDYRIELYIREANLFDVNLSRVIDNTTSTCIQWDQNKTSSFSLYFHSFWYRSDVIVKIYIESGTAKFQISYKNLYDGKTVSCPEIYKTNVRGQWVSTKCRQRHPIGHTLTITNTGGSGSISVCEIQAYPTKIGECDRPPDLRIPNGFFRIFQHEAYLSCADGFTGVNTTITCSNNVWREHGPRCDETLCQPYVYSSILDPGTEWIHSDSISKLSPGTRLILKCSPGYQKMGGPEEVTCQNNGTWTKTNATCTACPSPDIPMRGTYRPKKNTFLPGDKIVYTCDDGYVINGTEVRTCEPNGYWSDQTPFCDYRVRLEIQEANLFDVNLSRVIDNTTSTCIQWDQNKTSSFTPQLDFIWLFSNVIVKIYIESGTAKFQISYKSHMDGRTLSCPEIYKTIVRGQWVSTECRQGHPIGPITIKNTGGSGSISVCEIQAYPTHGSGCDRPPDLRIPNGFFRIYRHAAYLSCADGFTGVNTTITCSNNVWREHGPRCDEILCQPHEHNSTLDPGTEWMILDSVPKLSPGTRRRLICSPGYQKVGDPEEVTCQKNGTWTKTNATCIKNLCQPHVHNSNLDPGTEWIVLDSDRKLSLGSRRQLKCSSGYHKVGGPQEVTCQENGTWTETNATCLELSAKIKRNLLKYLFEDQDYDKRFRPVKNQKTAVPVTVGLTPLELKYNIQENFPWKLETWLAVRWKDEYLTWSPKDFGNIEQLILPASKVWIPDLSLYHNNLDSSFLSDVTTNVIVRFDGELKWVTLNSVLIQFDKKSLNCTISIKARTYNVSLMKVTAEHQGNKSLAHFKNHSWKLKSIEALEELGYFSWSEQPFSIIHFNVKFEIRLHEALTS